MSYCWGNYFRFSTVNNVVNKDEKTKTYCVIWSFDKVITRTAYISSWLSKGLSGESIKPPITSDNSLTTSIKLL